AKYYPKIDFLRAKLGYIPSFTWTSIWASKGVFEDGLCWRVGIGTKISIVDSLWVPKVENGRIQDGERCWVVKNFRMIIIKLGLGRRMGSLQFKVLTELFFKNLLWLIFYKIKLITKAFTGNYGA
ncbi:hypothetical protein J1N35_037544, partial [Gossypium stocksii]